MAWVTMDQIAATLGHPDVCQAEVNTGHCVKNIAFAMNRLVNYIH